MTYRLTYGATPNELAELSYPTDEDFVLGFVNNTTELKRIPLNTLPYPISAVPIQLFKTVTGNYTLSDNDHGYIIRVSGVSTITLPTTLLNGFQVTIFNETNNTKTFATPGTLLSKGNLLKTEYTAVYLTHVSSGTWIALGNLTDV